MGGSLRVLPDWAFSVTKTLYRFPALPVRFSLLDPGQGAQRHRALRCISLLCMHPPFLACAA